MPDHHPPSAALQPPAPRRRGAAWLASLCLIAAPAWAAQDALLGPLQNQLAPQAAHLQVPGNDETAAHQYRFHADFESLRGDALSISVLMDRAAGRLSMQGFGISEAEIEALRQACQDSGQCDGAEFDQRLARYFQEHKLRLRATPGQRARLSVDIPAVVRDSRAQVWPVAAALREMGREAARGEDWTLETAIALVQSGLAYRTPAAIEEGRKTLGFYTPPRALEKRYGDCDTKSALLAALLMNLGSERVVGVRVPDHYLLGVARAPQPGDRVVHYRGETFVLVEAAGPARRAPGQISDQTRAALDRGEPLRIDPMF